MNMLSKWSSIIIASQVNGFDFRDNMREFVAAANDTNIKVF